MIPFAYLGEWNFDGGTSLVLSILFLILLLLAWCIAAVNTVMVLRHFYLISDCLVKISSDHLVKICTVGLWIGCNLQVNVIKGVAIILLCTTEFLYICHFGNCFRYFRVCIYNHLESWL